MLDRQILHLLDRGRFSQEVRIGNAEIILETPSPEEGELLALLPFFDSAIRELIILIYEFKTPKIFFRKSNDKSQFWSELASYIQENWGPKELEKIEKIITNFYEERKKFFKTPVLERKILTEENIGVVRYWVNKIWPLRLSQQGIYSYPSDIFELISRIESSDLLFEFYAIAKDLNLSEADKKNLLYTLMGRAFEVAKIREALERINRGY